MLYVCCMYAAWMVAVSGAVGKQSVVGGDKLCASPWHAPYHFSRYAMPQ